MSEILLYLWSSRRSHLLRELDFYVAQADKRLFVQFGNLEKEAEQFARDEFDRMGQFAGPDSDPGDYAEAAWSKGIDHYEMLSDLHSQLLLSVAAGIYHQWEKRLREWLANEFEHSFPRERIGPAIWKQKIEDILDLLKGLGWDASSQAFFDAIEECRLIVNVFKHGRGPSFNDLMARYPQHLGNTTTELTTDLLEYRDHTDLKITREDLGRFQEALKDFWIAIPEHIYWDDKGTVPTWFEKALTKR